MDFKESSYSVVEDDSIFNVTLVKQGNPMQDILVFIIPIPGTVKCKYLFKMFLHNLHLNVAMYQCI